MEYEAYFDTEVIRGWYPIDTSRIIEPERIDEYIAQGLLRKINTENE